MSAESEFSKAVREQMRDDYKPMDERPRLGRKARGEEPLEDLERFPLDPVWLKIPPTTNNARRGAQR
jgi:hypothetical protein